MKIALLALSKQGKALGWQIQEGFASEIDFYLQENLLAEKEKFSSFPRGGLSRLMGKLFIEYDAIVCIMALGIVVRTIAPYIQDKRYDPAVVVIDELGKSVISVLSGHIGGANQLTRELAEFLHASPIITTATDLHGKLSLDLLAQQIKCRIYPFSNLKRISGAVVNDQPIIIYSQYSLPFSATEQIKLLDLADYNGEGEEAAVVLVTNKVMPLPRKKPYAFLRPSNVAIGVGCRRGISKEKILQAIESALEKTGLSRESLACLASIELKNDERGLLEAAEELGVPIKFFTAQQINAIEGELASSSFVQEKIGVNGVCEQTALLALKNPQLVLAKTVFVPAVTVAVAEELSL